MLNVLIADDESIILNGLKYTIESHPELHMSVVAFAKNGIEAFDKSKTVRPEIIITDINMPKCDGLDFISNLKTLDNYHPEIIILTGYSDFEYAKTAINLGVSFFLLKPINANELIDTLKKSVEKYTEKQNIQSQLSDYHTTISHRQNFFLIDLFLGKITQTDEIEKNFANYSIKRKKYFYIVNIKTRLSDSLLLSCFGYSDNLYLCNMNSSEHCLLVFNDAPDKIAISETLRNCYDKLTNDTSTELKIGISNFYSEYAFFSTAYYEALETAENSRDEIAFYSHQNNGYSKEVQYAIDVITRDYQNQIYINDIAESLHVSLSSLMHQFKRETGTTFVSYLTKFRIDKALELLKKSNMKIYEVAYSVGYSDTKYFTKIFKKTTGKSPSFYINKKDSADN